MRVKWNKEALEQLDFVVTYVRREFGNHVEEDTVRIADLWDTRREPHTQADNLK